MQRCVVLPLLAVLACLATETSAGAPVLSLVPTECGRYFTWQSLGIFYSHRKVGQAGKIVRVMCCTPTEAQQYADILQVVPTHVAPSYTHHPTNGDVYSAYNKPLAVLDYLSKNKVEEEYILVIDADMIFVQRFDPVMMGVRPGWGVSAFFGYMKGVYNELALKHVPEVLPRNDSLAGPPGRRGDMCGGFTFMMRDDLSRVAPLWLKYTEDVRFDPDAWRLSGDQYATQPGDKPWISEMYGYAYGCAKADVWHIAARTAMEYPEYELVEPPMVLHYGLEFSVPNTDYKYDKHWYYDFNALSCPPFNMDPTGKARSMKGLFNHPPMPATLKSTGIELMRDLYAIITINTVNEALCERHYVNCIPTEELDRECAMVHLISEQVNQGLAYLERQGVGRCDDGDPRCPMWAQAGECEKNAYYMLSVCRSACHQCTARPAESHLNDFSHAGWEDRFMQGLPDANAPPDATTAGDEDGSATEMQKALAEAAAAQEAEVKRLAQQAAGKARFAPKDKPKQGDAKGVGVTAGAFNQPGEEEAARARAVDPHQQHKEAAQAQAKAHATQQAVQQQATAAQAAQQVAQDAAAAARAAQRQQQQQEGETMENPPPVVTGATTTTTDAQEQLPQGHPKADAGAGGGGGVVAGTVVSDEVPAVQEVNHAQPSLQDTTGTTGEATTQQQRPVQGGQGGLLEGGSVSGDAADAVRRELQEEGEAGQVKQLVAKCRADTSLTPLQLEDCLSAASKAIPYVRPQAAANSKSRFDEAADLAVEVLRDDDDDDIAGGGGLMHHAAGGVGFMVWCGVGLLVFVLRPRCGFGGGGSNGLKRGPRAMSRRNLPL